MENNVKIIHEAAAREIENIGKELQRPRVHPANLHMLERQLQQYTNILKSLRIVAVAEIVADEERAE